MIMLSSLILTNTSWVKIKMIYWQNWLFVFRIMWDYQTSRFFQISYFEFTFFSRDCLTRTSTTTEWWRLFISCLQHSIRINKILKYFSVCQVLETIYTWKGNIGEHIEPEISDIEFRFSLPGILNISAWDVFLIHWSIFISNP